ncbi:MAG: hypothetical protein QOJ40_1751 [Verrucomicrobiota bacterium]
MKPGCKALVGPRSNLACLIASGVLGISVPNVQADLLGGLGLQKFQKSPDHVFIPPPPPPSGPVFSNPQPSPDQTAAEEALRKAEEERKAKEREAARIRAAALAAKQRGLQELAAKNWEQAVADLRTAARDLPKDAELQAKLAQAQKKLKEQKERQRRNREAFTPYESLRGSSALPLPTPADREVVKVNPFNPMGPAGPPSPSPIPNKPLAVDLPRGLWTRPVSKEESDSATVVTTPVQAPDAVAQATLFNVKSFDGDNGAYLNKGVDVPGNPLSSKPGDSSAVDLRPQGTAFFGRGGGSGSQIPPSVSGDANVVDLRGTRTDVVDPAVVRGDLGTLQSQGGAGIVQGTTDKLPAQNPVPQPPSRAITTVSGIPAQIARADNSAALRPGSQRHLTDSLPGVYLNDTSGKGNDTPYGIKGLPGVYVNGPRSGENATSPSDTKLRPMNNAEPLPKPKIPEAKSPAPSSPEEPQPVAAPPSSHLNESPQKQNPQEAASNSPQQQGDASRSAALNSAQQQSATSQAGATAPNPEDASAGARAGFDTALPSGNSPPFALRPNAQPLGKGGRGTGTPDNPAVLSSMGNPAKGQPYQVPAQSSAVTSAGQAQAKTILTPDAHNAPSHLLNELEGSIDKCSKVSGVSDLLHEGWQAAFRSQDKVALARFEEALKLDPKNERLHWLVLVERARVAQAGAVRKASGPTESLDHIVVPPPALSSNTEGTLSGLQSTASQLAFDAKVWLNDPMHRKWVGDAITIATLPLAADGAFAAALPAASGPKHIYLTAEEFLDIDVDAKNIIYHIKHADGYVKEMRWRVSGEYIDESAIKK